MRPRYYFKYLYGDSIWDTVKSCRHPHLKRIKVDIFGTLSIIMELLELRLDLKVIIDYQVRNIRSVSITTATARNLIAQ